MAFDVKIKEMAGSGLTRTVTAEVTNTGKSDAHNVWGKIEVFSQGVRARVAGNDFVRVDLGTVKAGQTATGQAAVQFGLFDGLRLKQNGANVVLTVNSDQGEQTFNYDIRP